MTNVDNYSPKTFTAGQKLRAFCRTTSAVRSINGESEASGSGQNLPILSANKKSLTKLQSTTKLGTEFHDRKDNTGINERDQSSAVKTPIDQTENQKDIKVTGTSSSLRSLQVVTACDERET